MGWTSSFVVYRIQEGKAVQVYQSDDFKEAKYWLSYIAQPGDVLCRTPKHPKHSGKAPCGEYVSHKKTSGSAAAAEAEWKEYAAGQNFDFKFPEAQAE